MELHVISSPHQSLSDLVQLWPRLVPYADAFHLRFKDRSAEEVFRVAKTLLEQGDLPPSSLYINSHVEVALQLGCGGVHLPEHQPIDPKTIRLLAGKLRLGRSVHSLQAALQAEREGMDYVMVGHVFPSPSKPGRKPLGTQRLKEMVKKIKIPTVAVGGIGPHNVEEILKTGCAGAAVISALAHHLTPELVAKEMKRRWNYAQ